MTVSPVALSALIADTRVVATRDAIVAQLARLLGGVKVVAHPGKLDINDILAKSVVAAPGIALGYQRIRELGDPGGTFGVAVDWAAYIVVEDFADTSVSPPRSIKREIVGHAIGLQLLRILRDPDTGTWGLPAIEPPGQDPGPVLVPVMTMKTAEQAASIYAVTWSQVLVQEGDPWFDQGAPIGADLDDFPEFPLADDGVDFTAPDLLPLLDPNLLPSEILARFMPRATDAPEPPAPPQDDPEIGLYFESGAAP